MPNFLPTKVNKVRQGQRYGLNTSKHSAQTPKVWASDTVYILYITLLIAISIYYMLSTIWGGTPKTPEFIIIVYLFLHI